MNSNDTIDHLRILLRRIENGECSFPYGGGQQHQNAVQAALTFMEQTILHPPVEGEPV